MKNLLLLLSFTLLSSNLFAQTSFAKAFEFYLGFKTSKNSEITWSDGNEVDILVVISEDKVKIYSSEIQEYRMTGKSTQTETGVRYFAVDSNGLQCFLYLGRKDDIMYLIIEYGDYAWMYLVTPND